MKQKTNILIIRNAFSYDFGGGERFPVDLAEELRSMDYSPTVLSSSKKLLNYASSKNLPHKHSWWWAKQDWSGKSLALTPIYFVWQIFLTSWYITQIIRLKPDIVHPQSKDDFIAATFAGRVLGRHVVWTDHADLKYVYQNHTVWYKNPIGKLVYRMSKWAHAVTLVSTSEASLIETALGRPLPSNYTVIHNGVKDIASQVNAVERPLKDQVIVATSRLVKAKGIGELIDAFNVVKTKHPRAKLWLVGNGPDAGIFKRQAKNYTDIVFWDHQDTPLPYVAAADIFVHPSYHEGFSISLVEAAMMEKPIIACGVGGNPEIIHDGKTGLLVNPRDSYNLAEALIYLLDNPSTAKRLAKNARAFYESDFQFDEIVKRKFIPLYEK